MATLSSREQLEGMRQAGKLAAKTLQMIASEVAPGVTTLKLDQLCHEFITDHGAIPAPLNYRGYPKSICTSVNEVVCHGIPSEKRVLQNGDIINIDVTVKLAGWHGDTSIMLPVGDANMAKQRLIDVTRECLLLGISLVKPGLRLGTLGHKIQKHAESHGYSVVRDYVGHGIGLEFHEYPEVRHFGDLNTGDALKEGMCFTIEPMINQGTAATKLLGDQWTVITKDRKLSAQWEHTITVTKDGFEILTQRDDEDLSFLNSLLDT